MNHTNHLRIAIAIVAGIAVAGLLGVRWGATLLVLLACPLMMFFMMRSMSHGHADHAGNQGHPNDRSPADKPVDW